jgi:hypothetical protein
MNRKEEGGKTMYEFAADALPLEAPEPECAFGIGQDVIVYGANGEDYDGYVVDTDARESRILVRAWDHLIGSWYTAFWNIDRVAAATEAATA